MRKNTVKIKICGLRSLEDIELINHFHPDFAGFIFAKSKRQVTAELAEQLRKKLDPAIPAIGVFVNQTIEEILSLEEKQIIQMIQLHGDEPVSYVKQLKEKTKLPVIKVIHMKSMEEETEEIQQEETQKEQSQKNHVQREITQIEQMHENQIQREIFQKQKLQNLVSDYETCCDYFLFDTATAGSYGGTGKRFSLADLPKTTKPYFLAGGITPENVLEFTENSGAFAIDVNSGVETDLKKDKNKLESIFNVI